MSGPCLKAAVGASGGGGGRTLYDTRVAATRGEHERVWTQNVPEYVDRGDAVSYKERRADLAEFVRQLEEDEMSKSRDGGDEKKGKDRTFYRLIYSFHEDPGDEKVKEMVSDHQRECLPKSYIINAIHRNSGHVHVHSVVAARQTDGSKLHLGWREYRTLDDKWARIYGKEFGEHFEREHLEKKEERRQHRIQAREAISRGERPPPRPERVSQKRNQIEEKVKIYERESGVGHADQRGVTGRGGRAEARAGGDEGFSRDRRREPARGSVGPQGGAGGEREQEAATTERTGHAQRDEQQRARALQGEGRAPARRSKRRLGRGGGGVREVAGAGGAPGGRAGVARPHDLGATTQAGHAAGSARPPERLDGGQERPLERGGGHPEQAGPDHSRAGGADRASRSGHAGGNRAEGVVPTLAVRADINQPQILGGHAIPDGNSGAGDVRNQLDTRLAEARSELTRTVALEKEREEHSREADKAASAPRSREEGLTPGAPQRDGPEPGRDAPDRDGPQRDAPTISFDR